MNPVIECLLNHRSYRHYDPDFSLPETDLDTIIACAQQAPSWMNGQHYSIIRISDAALRAQIQSLQPNNPQISQCSTFLVFVGDVYRNKLASDAYDGSFAAAGTPDTLITLCTDTALAAQNAIIAAESLGYATCPIGGLRLIAPQLVTLLGLPEYTFPLFGLCIGKAAIEMRIKPRLPRQTVFFDNQYRTDLAADLADYEHTMSAFGEARETLPYRQKFARYYSQTYAPANIPLLKQQGFLTKPEG